MMRSEFQELIGDIVTDEEWKLIELVYMHHPRDFDKEEVAQLWLLGGKEAFEGLRPLAEKVKALEEKQREWEKELREIENKLHELKIVHGKWRKMRKAEVGAC